MTTNNAITDCAQREAVLALLSDDSPYIGIEMPYGSGKTPIMLRVIETLLHSLPNSQPNHALVLCKPYNVATWQKEIEKWTSLPLLAIQGSPHTRHTQLAQLNASRQYYGPVVVLCSYSILLTKTYPFLLRHRWAMIVADESTTLKNPKAKTTKLAVALAASVRSGRRFLMTGNLCPEGRKEVWSQFAFTNIYPFGSTFYKMCRQWFVQDMYGGLVIEHDKRNKFDEIITKYIWQMSEEQVAELPFPDYRYYIHYYKFTVVQQNLIDYLYKHWALPAPDKTQPDLVFDYTLSIAQKAQQISSGVFYTDKSHNTYTVVDNRKNPKLQMAVGLIETLLFEQPTRKIVVWRAYQFESPMIQKELQEGKQHIRTVIGPDAQAIKEFESDKDTHVLIMPIECCSGFNELAVADVMIFFSQTFSMERRAQCEGRLIRRNQKASFVKIIDLCSSAQRDEEIIVAIQSKDLTPRRLSAIVVRDKDQIVMPCDVCHWSLTQNPGVDPCEECVGGSHQEPLRMEPKGITHVDKESK